MLLGFTPVALPVSDCYHCIYHRNTEGTIEGTTTTQHTPKGLGEEEAATGARNQDTPILIAIVVGSAAVLVLLIVYGACCVSSRRQVFGCLRSCGAKRAIGLHACWGGEATKHDVIR
jgi:hypothetical protein